VNPRPFFIVTCLALAGCGGASHPKPAATPPPLQRLRFDYAKRPRAGLVDHGVVARAGSISVRDVSYVSGAHRVAAYLVEPRGGGRRPAIVVVHGSGGDRRELLPAAIGLAQRGMVSLAITAPSSTQPSAPTSGARAYLAAAKAAVVHDVVAVRAAADALASLTDVDPKRIGYLGWSAGAKTGTFVAASDRRFKALALLSAGADKVSAYTSLAPAALRGLVARQLGSVDPLRYVAWARPGTVLLEDGTKDQIVPHRALLNMVHAAPQGTVVRWYATDHALNNAAYRYAFAWLGKKLHTVGTG
jgi:dienelactone hydrolase